MDAWRCQHCCAGNNCTDTCELAPCLRVVRVEHTQRYWVFVPPDLDEKTSHRVWWCTHSGMRCTNRRCKPMSAAICGRMMEWINILECTLIDTHSTMHHTRRQSHDRSHTTASSRGCWRKSGTPGVSLTQRGTGSLRIQSSRRSPHHGPVCITYTVRTAVGAHTQHMQMDNERLCRVQTDAMVHDRAHDRLLHLSCELSFAFSLSLSVQLQYCCCSFQSWSAMR